MDAGDFLLSLREGLEPWEEVAGRARVPLEQARLLAQSLRDLGYPLLLAEQGVGLAPGSPAPQLLFPRLRGRFGRPYRYLGVVSSTQDVLRVWHEAPEGALVVAERQTHGRGRLGRPWLSPPGNLYSSLLLVDPVPDLLPLRAGVALVQAAGHGRLKWPNDLLSPDGRKLGGILIERAGHRLLLGIGVNLEQAPLPTAAALGEFCRIRRVDLLADFLYLLEAWLNEPSSAVLEAWQEYDQTLGRKVCVHTPRGVVEGVAETILPDGALLVRTRQGRTRVHVGDVVLSPVQDIVDPQIRQGKPHS